MNKLTYDIRNLSLSESGHKKIDWAASRMPVLNLIKKEFSGAKLFKGITIAACLHVTSETANLLLTLKAGGARVVLCGCNPLSTQDEVAASLVKDFNIPVFAVKGEDEKTYYLHIEKVLDFHPQITLDDGGDLISVLHTKRKVQLKEIIGSNEETTTGVVRLKAMEKDKALKVPVMAVNFSKTKHMFDNRYGTGQSTIDGILRATNILLAGKKFVVAGYGWCGRGLSQRAKGMGCQVIVVEVSPVKALEAVMDGFSVMNMDEACKTGDIFVTVTGNKNVITWDHIRQMKDRSILANSGHFNVEIDLEGLNKNAVKKRKIRENVIEYRLKDGTSRIILAEGRLVNLVAAEGHPAEVMDMSFANQALACLWLITNKGKMANKVHQLPQEIDERIASLKLQSMGIKAEILTREQKKYQESWQEGT